jgi:hypothetical protein
LPRAGERVERLPPVEPLRTLSEALQLTELSRKSNGVMIRCDRLSDSNTVFETLRSLRDSYRPK